MLKKKKGGGGADDNIRPDKCLHIISSLPVCHLKCTQIDLPLTPHPFHTASVLCCSASLFLPPFPLLLSFCFCLLCLSADCVLISSFERVMILLC